MKKRINKLLKRLSKNIEGLHRTISYVKEETGYFRIYILLDIIRCYLCYDANYEEYKVFEFYDINKKKERTYLTKKRHKKIERYLYDKKELSVLSDRREFYKKFDKYLKRDVCYSKNLSFKQLEELIISKKEVVCKDSSMSDKNTLLLNVKNFRSPAYLLDEANKKKLFIIEENISQHKSIEKINPNNINILSIVTLRKWNQVDIIASTIKFGTSGNYEYDYKKSNYIIGCVDTKTGIIKSKLFNSNGKITNIHPVSKEKLSNLQVPLFDKATAMATKCALELDRILEVEWNFMISNNKVLLINANLWNDYLFSQIPEYLPKKEGFMNYYKNVK